MVIILYIKGILGLLNKLLIIFTLFISIGPANGQQADVPNEAIRPFVLQWGFVHLPPLAYLDKNGEAKGDLNAIMAGTSLFSGIPYEPFEFPNARAIYNLNSHHVNFAIGVKSIVSDPDKFVFSSFPVSAMQLDILWKKGIEDVDSVDDLTGKRLVLLAGYTYAGLRDKLQRIAKSYIEVENHERAIGALALKRGNYALTYRSASEYSISPFEHEDFRSKVIAEVDLYFILNKGVESAESIMQRLEAGYLQYQQEQISKAKADINID